MSNNKQIRIEEEFVPYEEALALKELGFDEPCFAFYVDKQLQINATYQNHLEFKGWVAAPTFSQAFRFFREKHGLNSFVYHYGKDGILDTTYFAYNINDNLYADFRTHEEGELSCLKKLIEVAKARG